MRLAAAGLVLLCASPASADQSITASRPGARFGTLRPAVFLPADPKIDASMLVEPRAGGIDYKIRAIDPPICNAAR